MKTNTTRFAAILSIGLMFLMPIYAAFADSVSFQQLSAEWEQWALSIPTTENPELDTTGEKCMVGQHGSIWFLAGFFQGGTATRTCSVPEGKSLYFPVINFVNINAPNVCGQGNENVSAKVLRDQAAGFIDAAANLSVTVDGVPIKSLTRVKSQVFAVALPNDNVFNSLCGGPGSVPAGIYSPAVDDGFYVLLNPLSVGIHTLHFHAESPAGTTQQEITYNLKVVAVLNK